MNKKIIIIVLLLILIIAVFYVERQNNQRDVEVNESVVSAATPSSETEETESETQTETETEDENEIKEVRSAVAGERYVNYSPELVNEITNDGDKALLFFHAAWCPTCRRADKEIRDNISKIPSDVTIFKVNYDTEKELRNKYRINYQHTFVQVDRNGDSINKQQGPVRIDDILSVVR